MIDRTSRSYLFVVIVIAAALMGGRFAQRETVKLGCLPEGGRSPAGAWEVGCGSDQIGSYELAALWFGLEPKALEAILRAKVLVFGDSRILHAMLSGDASDWFAKRGVPMDLMAFGNGEQSGWANRLVQRLHPRPQLVVFDADPYFTGEQSIPAQAITDDPAGEEKTARNIKAFLDNGPRTCGFLPWLCGRTAQAFRQYSDGVGVQIPEDRVWFHKNQDGSFPVTKPGAQETSHYASYLANARALIDKLQVDPKCVVFTIVPNSEMDDTLAKYLAIQLGGRAVAPWIDGLSTSDHFHLTADSGLKWSKEFLSELEPVVQECTQASAASGEPDGPRVVPIRLDQDVTTEH